MINKNSPHRYHDAVCSFSFIPKLPSTAALSLSTLFLLAACSGENTNSPELQGSAYTDTSRLEARMRVTALSNNSAHVEVQLFDVTDAHTAIFLENGDRISARSAVESIDLNRESTAAIPTYEGDLSGAAPGALVVMGVERTSPPDLNAAWFPAEIVGTPELEEYFVNADSSMVRLPEAFTIEQPSPNQEFRPGADVTLTWAPTTTADVVTRLEWQTVCPEFDDDFQQEVSGGKTVSDESDPGTFTLSIESFTTGLDPLQTEPCRIRVNVIREVQGEVDPTLAGSSYIVGAQKRSVSIRYLP